MKKIRTSVVGGQPGWLKTPRRVNEDKWYHQGKFVTYSEIKNLVEETIEACIRKQEEVGLDILSEGEMFRFHFVNYTPRFLNGVEDTFEHLGNYSSMNISGPLSLRTNGLLEDWQKAQSYSHLPVKINLPGPHIFANYIPSTYYKDKKSICLAYAEVLNQIIRELIDAGCQWIQLDDPELAWNPGEAIDFGLKGLNKALEDLPLQKTNIVVHLCRANHYSFKKAEDIIKLTTHYKTLTQPFANSPVTTISIEGPCHQEPIDEDFNFFSFPDKEIMLGVVDINVEQVESVACIQAKINNALKKVSPEKLIISPNCGMKHFSVEQGYQKLNNMIEAVALCNANLEQHPNDIERMQAK